MNVGFPECFSHTDKLRQGDEKKKKLRATREIMMLTTTATMLIFICIALFKTVTKYFTQNKMQE